MAWLVERFLSALPGMLKGIRTPDAVPCDRLEGLWPHPRLPIGPDRRKSRLSVLHLLCCALGSAVPGAWAT
jgi:hypothetical protein